MWASLSNVRHIKLKACLADEELTLEEESMEETRSKAEEEQQRILMAAQRLEEERRAREERIRKNREHRENVISELVVTEREFCRDLKLMWQAFGLDTPAMLEQRGVDVPVLFGNIGEVIDVSERFLDSLQEEVKSKSSAEEQMVGRCFLQHADTMKSVYAEYCINHDKAEQLLEKYDQVQEIQRMLQKGVETLKSQVSCFNMGSILIKPVQRILKYPLILNELIKCTEDNHLDSHDLHEAVTIMSAVASFINESKRRKDIIDKYKAEEEKTLTRRISKLNMHSIGKKSSRISQKILSSIGIDPLNRHLDFDELEKRFSFLIRTVQAFASDSQRFREQLHETVLAQYNIAETVAELYKDRGHLREVERFRAAHKKVLASFWHDFTTKMEPRVVKPLAQLIETFQGPTRLIQKRHDKQLDLQASMQRAEKNRDPNKTRTLSEEVDKCRSTFEALNSQLLEELPKLLDIATSIFRGSVTEFVLLRMTFVGKVTKELLSLMDLPLLGGASGDILEVFLVKHSLVCSQLGRFSFSKTFKSDEKKKLTNSPNGGQQQLGQKNLEVVPQTANIRTLLRGKYAAAKLYQANEPYLPTDLLDIGINPGDLVGVLQKKDPMGSDKRWFVDNGLTQGFLPCHILTPIGEAPSVDIQTPPAPSMKHCQPEMMMAVIAEEAVVHSYDDVAADEELTSGETEEVKKPTRKAPNVPTDVDKNNDEPNHVTGNEAVEPEMVEAKSRKSMSAVEAVERSSHHSYEEIAASEAASEPSQDLSPIYEEIHGGTRSTISSSSTCSSNTTGSQSVISRSSSGSGNSSRLTGNESAAAPAAGSTSSTLAVPLIERGKFYFALYEFTASESTMLNLFRGQVVRVVQLTAGDWCYVEDRHGTKGYVPSSYLKLYSQHQNINNNNNTEDGKKDLPH